jgi:transcriptional regulator with GAF, ATPase, and Fis domain
VADRPDAQDPEDAITEGLIRQLDDVTAALDGLTEVMRQEEDLGVILHRACLQAIHAIPEADAASVVLLRDNEPHTAAATDDVAAGADLAQYRAGEGPCLEAAKSSEVIRVSVTEAEDHWPGFADAARTLGVTSYLSAPLFVDQEYHGSLNLYAEQEHGFCRLDAALLELYTTAAEGALANARRYLRSREHIAQLRRALTSRAVIDQAKGIIMAANRVDADEAFELLVQRSQQENLKLKDLASRFIDDIIRSDT